MNPLNALIRKFLTPPDTGSVTDTINPQDVGPVFVFIRSFNRPLYLWACLDSLFRQTAFPCRFVLVDNASTDPLVRQIVSGFQRRTMFHSVHFMNQNEACNQSMVFFRYREELGRYLILLDGDITVEASRPCWLTRLISHAEQRPDLGAIGSGVDTRDFVDPETASHLFPDHSPRQLAELIKLDSPERRQTDSQGPLVSPHNPPGRLLLLRTDIFRPIGLPIGTARICKAVTAAGLSHSIATDVKHRHLSLLNVFDYPEHDFAQLRRYLKVAS